MPSDPTEPGQMMDRFHLTTERDAANLALGRPAGEPLEVDAARALRGSGWDGASPT